MLLLAAGFAQAQAPAPVDSGVVIQTETRVVLVDTIVTDKKGEYLRNLTAKDFKVWEDNKEQTIKSFSYESGAVNPANPLRRYIVLFFDNSTMDFGTQAQARQAAGKFIDANAGPNRLMAIVNFGGAIQIAQNFTDDAERLKRVVSGAKLAAVTPNGDSTMPDALSKAAADFGVHDMLLALRSMAKDLNAVPGRKTLILFGSGFPLTPERMSEITAAIDTCNKSNVAVYPIDVRGLMSGVPVAGLYTPLSIFPTRGLVASTAFLPGSLLSGSTAFFQKGGGAPAGGGAAGGGGRGGGAPAAPTGGGGRSGGAPAPAPAPTSGRGGSPVAGRGVNPNNPNSPFNPFNTNSQARNSLIPKMPDSGVDNQLFMHMLADGTGGFVIKNTNDLFAGLQKIGKELAEYYILGYTPPMSEEGACHALKVKVNQGGAEVRARTGYCDSKSTDLLTKDMPIEKTLESRVAGTQAGTVAASMQLPYFYTGLNTARVNVAMEIPGSALKFDKVKGKFHAEMNILGIAYKPDGSVGARFSDTLKRDFEDKKMVEAFEKQPFHYENQFDVASGQYKLKVAFTSGTDFGKLEMPLAIDPWQNKDFSISALALSHQVRPTAEAGANLDQSLLDDRTPLVTAGLQVIPAGSNKFSKTSPPLFYMEVYEPAVLNAGDQKLAVALQIRVLDRKSGEQKSSTGMMRVDLPEKSESPMIPLGERIPIDMLAAGQYTVEVQALSMGGSQVKRTADFDLE
jgi:VWFA-related protein